MTDEDIITLPKRAARFIFDVAVGSMNFSSGMMDHEEVEHLRDFAVLIGVDPMEATPLEWRLQYPHAFKPFKMYRATDPTMNRGRGHSWLHTSASKGDPVEWACEWDQAVRDHPAHRGGSA